MPRCDELLQAEEITLFTRKLERVKADLAFTAEDIVGRMAGAKPENLCDPASPEASVILAQYNVGGLVQYFYGDAGRARGVCYKAIDLCQRLADRTGDRGWLIYAVQPHINLGRIQAAKGDLPGSLRVFEDVYQHFATRAKLAIQGIILDDADMTNMIRIEPAMEKVALNVYVKDSIRAFQYARDYEGLLGFTRRLHNDTTFQVPSVFPSILEGEARALVALGQYNAALAVLTELKSQVSREPVPNVSVLTLISDAYRRAGRADLAKKVLNSVEQYLIDMEKAKVSPVLIWQVAYALALGQYMLAEYDRSYANAKVALEVATEVNDETWVIRALILLLNLAPVRTAEPNNRMGPAFWYEQLKWATAGTLYRFERAMGSSALAEAASTLGEEVAAGGDRAVFLRHAKQLFQSLEIKGCAERAEEIGRALALQPCDSEESAAFFDEESQQNLSVEDAYRVLSDFADSFARDIHASHAA